MTLDQLKVLLTVKQTGSFQAASEVLYRSRPAVSIAIKNLEEELGLQLFSRDQYRPELTVEGRIFCEKAKKVLNHADSLLTLGEQMALGYEPELNFTINAICPLLPVMTIIHLFQADHPLTKMNLSVEYGKRAMEKLCSGEADLAMTELENRDTRLESIKWTTVTLMPIITPAYDLADTREGIHLEEIMDYTQIVVKDSSQNIISKQMYEVEEGDSWTVNDFYIQKQVILSALGWGFIPTHLIQKELHNGSLIPLKIKNLREITLDIFLVRRTDRPIGPIAQEIWNNLLGE